MKCLLCGSPKFKVLFKLGNYYVLRCMECGLDYNSEFPPKKSKEESFSENYFSNVQCEAFKFHGETYLNDPSIPIFKKWLNIIEKNVTKGNILDVGCGLGTFLAAAKKNEWIVQGLDVSEFAATTVKEKLGIDVFTGSLTKAPWVKESFDAITFWDSIEHTDDPKGYLKKANELLKPGGLALITTDNFDFLMGYIGKMMYYLSFGKFKYPLKRLFIPYNATYFTEKIFRKMVDECGFEIIAFEKMEYPLSKIKTNAAEKFILSVFYLFAKLIKKQAQFTMILRKRKDRD